MIRRLSLMHNLLHTCRLVFFIASQSSAQSLHGSHRSPWMWGFASLTSRLSLVYPILLASPTFTLSQNIIASSLSPCIRNLIQGRLLSRSYRLYTFTLCSDFLDSSIDSFFLILFLNISTQPWCCNCFIAYSIQLGLYPLLQEVLRYSTRKYITAVKSMMQYSTWPLVVGRLYPTLLLDSLSPSLRLPTTLPTTVAMELQLSNFHIFILIYNLVMDKSTPHPMGDIPLPHLYPIATRDVSSPNCN